MSADPRVSEVLTHYRCRATSVCRVSGGFSGATVWQIETIPGITYALRWTPRSVALPLSRIVALHALLRRVFQSGFRRIAVPVSLPSGASIMRMDEGCWQLEPWMPGHSVAGTQATDLQIRNAVVALFEFWQRAAASSRDAASDDWFCCRTDCSPSVIRRRQIVAELRFGQLDDLHRRMKSDPDAEYREFGRIITDLIRERLSGLEYRLREVEGQPFRLQPVIRDLRSPHLLFCGDNLSGLIDLTACGTDHMSVDLSRLLRSWFGMNHDRVEFFLRHVEDVCPLSITERHLLSVLDESSVVLSPVTWLRRRIQEVAVSQKSSGSQSSFIGWADECGFSGVEEAPDSSSSGPSMESGHSSVRFHLRSLISQLAVHQRL